MATLSTVLRDDFFEGLFPAKAFFRNPAAFSPSVDADETDTHYWLNFDLPGISKDDLKIEYLDGELVVSGERKLEKKDENGPRLFSERAHGRFERTFALPKSVDPEKIEADYQDGVLRVSIPKAEAAKPRLIKIA